MKRYIWAILILIVIVSPLIAQQAVDDKTIEALLARNTRFIDLILEDSYKDAFDYIRSFPNAIKDTDFDTLQITAESQLPQIVPMYGRKLDAKAIGYNVISDFMLRALYVVRHERHFVWWQFIYYRGEYRGRGEWLLSSISFNDNAGELMKEMF